MLNSCFKKYFLKTLTRVCAHSLCVADSALQVGIPVHGKKPYGVHTSDSKKIYFRNSHVIRTRAARVGVEYSNHYTINACRKLRSNFVLFILTYS